MKIRNGFVSNSSSSSFIVSIKINKKEMTTKELFDYNMKQYDICFGDSRDEEEEVWRANKIKKIKNYKIIYYGSVDYDAVDSVEKAIKGVLKGLDIDSKNIKIEFDE